MAQTLNMPEPKQDTAGASVASGSNASADDLLSQLAGDEIDRLLAEAEIEKPSTMSASPAPEAVPAEPQTLSSIADSTPVTIEPAGAIETHSELKSPASVEYAPVDPAPTESAHVNTATQQAQSEAAVSAELDELFKELNTDQKPAESATVGHASTAGAQPSIAAGVAATNAASAAQVVEAPTSDQERAALDAPTAETDVENDEDEASTGVPIYLKPLELLNFPLKFVPEGSRDLVGKFAIISFMNAISVLVYLLVFHRH